MGAALALFCTIIGIVLHSTEALQPIEIGILDQKFRAMQREDTTGDVVIVALDANSLNQFSERFNIYWPWPREYYALVLDYLMEDGAKVVTFDVLFDRPDIDRLDTDGATSDGRLGRVLEKWPNTILASTITAGSDTLPGNPRPFPYQTIQPEGRLPAPNTGFSSLPIDAFLQSVYSVATANMEPDQDGVIRHLRLLEPISDSTAVPSLSLAAYISGLGEVPDITIKSDELQVGDLTIPVDSDERYTINWYKKGGTVDGTFTYFGFYQVFQSAWLALNRPESGRPFPPGTFKDKYVFIGASATGLSDTRSTPFSALEPYPGVEIHATAMANLLDRNFVTHFDTALVYLLLFIVNLSMVTLVFYVRPTISSIGGIAILAGIVFTGFLLFGSERIWLPTGLFALSSVYTFFPALVYRYYSEEKQKQEIKSAFSRYVQKELVSELMSSPEKLRLGGEKKKLTIMFSDLAGFTSISEAMTPEELVELLNAYLGAMTNIIFEHKGTLDKYIGDAIMAFWGAPIDQQEQEILACKSVLSMIDHLNKLRVEWLAKGLPDVFARYGINTGQAVAGNMGSETRFNYTVMGDTVNLAARLEPANKVYNTTAMISEFTYAAVKDELICRQLDKLVVKGKSKPVTVYELVADRKELATNQTLGTVIDTYNEALALYFEREWIQSALKFEKVLDVWPDDGPAKLYVSRAQHYMHNPPDKNWNGVFTMTTK